MFKKLTDSYIIAEIGVNHNGSIILAKKLIDIAVESGADFAKFQIFLPAFLTFCYYFGKIQASFGCHKLLAFLLLAFGIIDIIHCCTTT